MFFIFSQKKRERSGEPAGNLRGSPQNRKNHRKSNFFSKDQNNFKKHAKLQKNTQTSQNTKNKKEKNKET